MASQKDNIHRTGVLVHVYHIKTVGWERLIWGDPSTNSLGSLTMLVDCLLRESHDEPITDIIIGCGPSVKNGKNEGQHTKQYLLDHFNELQTFPRLAKRLTVFTDEERRTLLQRLNAIAVTPLIDNTLDEIETAARMFNERAVDKIIQIAVASHAPRCIKAQEQVREKGLIPKDQQWFVIATDMYFGDGSPNDTVIIERPHRGDDPMINKRPLLSEFLGQYYSLLPDAKQQFTLAVEQALQKAKDTSE